MDEEECRNVLLSIDYNKLLSYLAGVLVFFFMLFQISTDKNDLPWYFVFIMSLASLIGVILFIRASYHNYEEIIVQENKLGISAVMEPPSGTFSQRKNENTYEREISCKLKFLVWMVLITSVFIFLYNNIGAIIGAIDWILLKLGMI